MATETDEESRHATTDDDGDVPWCAPTTGDRRRKRIKRCANILFVASFILLVLGVIAYFVGVLGNWPASIIALVFCFAACFMIISFLMLLWFSKPNPALNRQQEAPVESDVKMASSRIQLAEELDEFQLALAMSLSEKDTNAVAQRRQADLLAEYQASRFNGNPSGN
jgi:hypothetical protein